ncbi:MAG: hypothetical protein R6V49_11610 [Bacteroidales bacterium]
MKPMRQMVMRILFLLTLACISVVVAAQDIPFDKEHFPDQRKELNQARKDMKRGIKLVGKGIGSWDEAMRRLTAAHAFNPQNAKLNLAIGELLFRGPDPYKALPYFETAHSLKPGISPLLKLQLGRAYHLNHRFQDAIRFYDEYYVTMSRREIRRTGDQVALWRDWSIIGDSLMQQPVRCFVDPMGDRINSPWPEYAPVLSADGTRLWFTSRRPGSTGGKTDAGNLPFEDIYYIDKLGIAWSDPVNAGEGINTPMHEAFVAVSQEGHKIYIRRGEPTGDILSLDWPLLKKPKAERLSGKINSSANETFGSFSPGGDTLWFVSNRKRGFGGKDIWITTKNTRGKWGKPVNAGPVINTPMDEESPFLANDGQTFYFSSRGHETMGGYDIFTANLTEQGFSERRNLGWPINSASDDLFFILDPNGRHGYFASRRAGGRGHFDLYKFTAVAEEKPLLFKVDIAEATLFPEAGTAAIIPVGSDETPDQLLLLQGRVMDAETNAPLSAIISARDRNTGVILATAVSDSISGKYIMMVSNAAPLVVRVTAPGKVFLSAYHDLAWMAPYTIREIDFRMNALAHGIVVPLNNLAFQEGQSDFEPETAEELVVLADMLKENPMLKIRVLALPREGESDPDLNVRRIETVKQELIGNGIDPERILTDPVEVPFTDPDSLPVDAPIPVIAVIVVLG